MKNSYFIFSTTFQTYNVFLFQDTNEEDADNVDVKQPLLYVMIDQPNIYISQQNVTQKLQVRPNL